MKRRWQLTLALMLAATTITASPAAEETLSSDWKTLPLIENGELAPAWKHTGFGKFTVVDGVLRTDNDPRGLGLLYFAPKQFGNCQIRVVYRPKEQTSNSGVYVRIADGLPEAKPLDPAHRAADGTLPEDQLEVMKTASKQEQGPWYAVHHGYEVQICDEADPAHRTGSIYSLTSAESFPESEGDWNTMVITLDGTRIAVAINGKTVSHFDSTSDDIPDREIWYEPKREPKRPITGYLGLQNHDPDDVVFFKSVSIRPLPQ